MPESDPRTPLYKLFVTAPIAHDIRRAEQGMSGINEKAADSTELAPLADILKDDTTLGVMRGTIGCSPYLAALIERDPARLLRILSAPPEHLLEKLTGDLKNAVDAANSMNDAMKALRVFKNEAALLLALCDLGGVWGVMKITHALSQVADASVGAALGFLFRQAVAKGDWLDDCGATENVSGSATPESNSGYFVLAMGKHGAYELNYSSDIDLIVFYDAERARLRDGVEIKTFFVKVTKDLVKLMQERTGDGYVFRTDLRLRPDPSATQVAISTEAGLIYYESFGQNWERAALIKARTIAGDFEAGDAMLRDLSPFIWRKYLDYASIADIHAMKRQIHAFKGFGTIAVAGHNIKLGRGGIREIEFFVQTQQLIAGGRQIDLRVPATLAALDQLVERGWILREVQRDLEVAYKFLRKLEHRLQMINDEQTQVLPSDDDELRRVALFAGYETVEAFGEALRAQLENVQTHYSSLFEDDDEDSGAKSNLVFSGEDDDPDTINALRAMGYQTPKQVVAAVRSWHRGRYPAVRSARGRESLTELQPILIEALSRTSQPDAAVIAFDRFLEQLPTGVQLFALLKANPSLLRLFADIMGSAPRLARIMGRRRRVLDAVLDPGFFGKVPTEQELARLVDHELDEAEDFQDVLDRARVVGNEQAFLIGVRVLSGTISAGRAGKVYAALAERLIDCLQRQVTRELENAHGKVAGGDACVIAMGKLGGGEMTAASDLDLILIYDYDRSVERSEGAKPLSPVQYYMRMTQRLINALSAPTANGTLYEVDMRLRPSGNKGPVATKLASFIDYQHADAWTWEHMALTRARVISGSPELRTQVEKAIREVLLIPRDEVVIAADLRDMRARLEGEKGTVDIWQLKQVRGGIVDLEFIVQYLQLIYASQHPDVLAQNTIQAVNNLATAGVITRPDADKLLEAANLYNNLTQVLRLCLDEPFDPDSAPEGLKDLLCRAAEMPDFQHVEALLKTSLRDTFALFERLIK